MSLIFCAVMAYVTWRVQRENQKLSIVNTIFEHEHRIIKDGMEELREKIIEYKEKPTYDQGYKDALVKLGGPQNAGSYQEGWDDATKAYGIFERVDGKLSYADGYHAAINQFGYTKPASMNRWLAPDPEDKKISSESPETLTNY